jgi:hypothetical protein
VTPTKDALRHDAEALRIRARQLTEAYRRATWIRFALVFIPVPFVLVLLRLQIEAWHYFVFGAAYIGLSALLYVIDGRASDRCDAAERAADEAQRVYSEALASERR